ncbi:MAG: universal stress protein [Lentisphaerota bacterium]|jgi:nucleotide-binding universal stress UspA family protein
MNTITCKQILCPVDFSDFSDYAMRYAALLAQKFEARLTLLHVVAPILVPLPGDALVPPMRQADLADIADACRERLTRTAGDLAEKGMAVACQVTSGVPYLEILRMAEELHADMIVMGTHGRSGLVHLMIGSVAERVVRKAPCAVLTVKRH